MRNTAYCIGRRGITAVLLMVFALAPLGAYAQTTDMASLIAQLQAQISALQAQINTLQTRQLAPPIFSPEEPLPSSSPTLRAAACPNIIARALYLGLRGPDVSELQQFLRERGYFTYPTNTGYFGPSTEQAVQDFQKAQGIVSSGDPETTGFGVVGRQTRDAIAKACGGFVAKPLPPPFCIQVITPAQNPTTGECKNFPTPCDVPAGWERNTCSLPEKTPPSHVGNLQPVISGVSGPTTLQVGEQGTWTVKAYDPEQGQLTYSVRWGDEQFTSTAPGSAIPYFFQESQTATFTHSYATQGTFVPVFIVTDNSNQQANTRISVNVGGGSTTNPPKIVSVPAIPSSISPGQQVSFNWSATDADNDDLSWNVTWGDETGGISTPCWSYPPISTNSPTTGQGRGWTFSALHAWARAGVYTMRTTVTDCGKGSSDSRTIQVVVGSVTTTQSISIADVMGVQGSYTAGQLISLSIKAIESDGTAGTPIEGFNVQAYIFDSTRTTTYTWKNATYNPNTNYWDVVLNAPSDTSNTYGLEVLFYCSDGSSCVNKYGSAIQQRKWYVFSVVTPSPPPPPTTASITVISPNGGEEWQIGSTQTIRWSGGLSTNPVFIYLYDWSTKSTASFIPTAVMSGSTQNDGIETVTIPTSVSRGSYFVRVGYDKSFFDDSDSLFVIKEASVVTATTTIQPTVTVVFPNGGEVFQAGSYQTIKWSGGGTNWTIGVMLQNSGGITARTIAQGISNNGSIGWVVPNDIPLGAYKIRISCGNCYNLYQISGIGPFDDSDGTFSITGTISKPASIILSSPNGGETVIVDSSFKVTWTVSGDTAYRQYAQFWFERGGTRLGQIGFNKPNDGPDPLMESFVWNGYYYDSLGNPTRPQSGNDYRITVIMYGIVNNVSGVEMARDTSNAPFSIISAPTQQPTITVVSPNGGEQLTQGSIQTIRWNSTGLPADAKVTLYFWNNPYTLSYLMSPLCIANDGNETIVLPSMPAGNYKAVVYRCENSNSTDPMDTSDAPFSIVGALTQPSITVLSPNGGETLTIGTSYALKWNTNTANKSLRLLLVTENSPYPFGFNDWEITEPLSTGGIQSYNWTVGDSIRGGYISSTTVTLVPGPHRLRICDLSSSNSGSNMVCDDSDRLFSVVAPSPPPPPTTSSVVSQQLTANTLSAVQSLIDQIQVILDNWR